MAVIHLFYQVPRANAYVFEKINDFSSEDSKEQLIEKIRLSLSRQITKDLFAGKSSLKVIELSTKTIETFYASSICGDGDGVVKVDSDAVLKLVRKIKRFAKAADLDEIIILAPFEIRLMTFLIFSEFINNLRVIAFEELRHDADVETVGEI